MSVSERVQFTECVAMCASNPEFVAHVERLTGHRFGFAHPRAPIEAAVDEASGRDEADMARFVALVDELVWSRLAPEPVP